MTANLQVGRVTVRQAAKIMNISERSVYVARRIVASGRTDLMEAVEQGRMTLHAAMGCLRPAPRRDGLRALARAWAGATAEERETFLLALEKVTA